MQLDPWSRFDMRRITSERQIWRSAWIQWFFAAIPFSFSRFLKIPSPKLRYISYQINMQRRPVNNSTLPARLSRGVFFCYRRRYRQCLTGNCILTCRGTSHAVRLKNRCSSTARVSRWDAIPSLLVCRILISRLLQLLFVCILTSLGVVTVMGQDELLA